MLSKLLILLLGIVVAFETTLILIFYKEEKNMVAVYVALIIAGRRTLDQVPLTIRAKVKDDLLALGLYDLAGEP